MNRLAQEGGHSGSHDCPLNLKIMEGAKGEVVKTEDEVSKG